MYVKLISDGTWFVKGSEVWHYNKFERISLDEWQEWQKAGIVDCRGLCFDSGLEVGYIDGETCVIDEFNVEIVENKTPYS
jgi:hypothetical protein